MALSAKGTKPRLSIAFSYPVLIERRCDVTQTYEKELSLKQLAALSDDEINYDDISELDETFWQNATYIEPQPNGRLTQEKVPSET